MFIAVVAITRPKSQVNSSIITMVTPSCIPVASRISNDTYLNRFNFKVA